MKQDDQGPGRPAWPAPTIEPVEVYQGERVQRVSRPGRVAYLAAGYCEPTLDLARLRIEEHQILNRRKAAWADYRASRGGLG